MSAPYIRPETPKCAIFHCMTTEPLTSEEEFKKEMKAAFESSRLALDAITPENEAIVLAILSLSHQVRLAAKEIVHRLPS